MKLTDDLSDPKWIMAKGWLFLCLGILASIGLLTISPTWQTALFLALALWGFCRWYYFMFYVIQHHVDPSFKFDGLGSFLKYLFNKRRN